jgi:hypothetical protein
MDAYRATVIILIFIVIVGIIAIPFGNPKFIDRAITLELIFVILSALVWKRYSRALYACIPLAVLVMIGNSLAQPHVQIMTTFSKPLNAVVLIIGGYVLQVALMYTSLRSIMALKSKRLATAT